MKNLIFLILIASLEIKGGTFLLSQKEAVLGEPVIIESSNETTIPSSGYIFLNGPTILCLEISRFQYQRRINLVDLFKVYGEYEIKIIDFPDICDKIKNVRDAKEMLEQEEDEGQRKFLIQRLEYFEMSLKSEMERIKRFPSFKIKINYPIDFDKYLYENFLSKKENLSEFWERGYSNENLDEWRNFIDEILKHRESNYFPWAIYITLNGEIRYTGESLKSKNAPFDKEAKGILKKHAKREELEFIKEIVKGIEKVENDFKGFPFLDELILHKGILLFLLGEREEELGGIFSSVITKAKHKETREVAEGFLKLISKE